MEHDYLDCIVAMPTDMFYNTNIATYLWFMSNRKSPERKGKVLLIDASGMSRMMKKNLGKKRREFTEDCIARITKAYAEFKEMDWHDIDSERNLKAKVFKSEHFFYRKVTIERPLRCRFQASAESVAGLLADKAYAKLPTEQRDALKIAVSKLDTMAIYTDAETFRAALQEMAKNADIKKPLGAKSLELARKYLATRDKNAEPTTNEKGDVLSDSDLRDAEYVPFGEDVDSYFDREVVPHWPDAWINRDIKDDKDKLVGIVGTEINFNREFYTYIPPRSRETIRAEIEVMEKRFMDMLHGVSG
jgi:type I restriction enzyme M protein